MFARDGDKATQKAAMIAGTIMALIFFGAALTPDVDSVLALQNMQSPADALATEGDSGDGRCSVG